MCLIIFKEAHKEYDHGFITNSIKNSAVKNQSGFGFAVKNEKDVLVKKGFKNVNSFIKSLSWYNTKGFFKGKEVLIHLRNSSMGTATNLITTHPIIANEKENNEIKINTKKSVLVHNGFISSLRNAGDSDSSDTLEFVKKFLMVPNGFEFMSYMNRHWESKFSNFFDIWTGFSSGNKIIVMKAGCDTLRKGVFEEERGMLFSNTSYKDTFPEEWRAKNAPVVTERPSSRRAIIDSQTAWEEDDNYEDYIANAYRQGNQNCRVGDPADIGKAYSRTMKAKESHNTVAIDSVLAKGGNNCLYSTFSEEVEISKSSGNFPMNVRFFYRSVDLEETFPNRARIASVNPFDCVDNEGFKKHDCILGNMGSKGCCRNIEKENQYDIMAYRNEMKKFISLGRWEKESLSNRLRDSTVNILEAIDDSPAPIEYFWYDCHNCTSKGKVNQFNSLTTCTTCRGFKLRLGLSINIGTISNTKRMMIDGISLYTDPVYGNENMTRISTNAFLATIIDNVKRTTSIINEETKSKRMTLKETKESHNVKIVNEKTNPRPGFVDVSGE
jgi:hypothetical protein